MSNNIRILWVDDEIELLKAHVIYLKEKDFEVTTASNGQEALTIVENENFDIIFLDENMPGLSGLEVLNSIKLIAPNTPVVMITKSEEEDIMDQAIGRRISDYLIKPVNPKQILLTIKKHVSKDRLVAEKTTQDYQTQFGQIGLKINQANSFDEWVEVYKSLVNWEVGLEKTKGEMDEVLKMQKTEANHAFAKFVKSNYINWIQNPSEDTPLMSHNLLKDKALPLLKKGKKVVFIVIDNFRYDQWLTIREHLAGGFNLTEEDVYSSILPTATQFARNAIFSGLMPDKIKQMYPEFWIDETEEGSKNQFESELIGTFFDRFREKFTHCYHKVGSPESGKELLDNWKNMFANDFIAIVFNFVDMLSHARTDSRMIKELASDEAAYRSLSDSWFKHSSLKAVLDILEDEKATVIITTDHGTIRVKNPVKIVGDKTVSTNLRYKQGKNLAYKAKDVYDIQKPEEVLLPKLNVSTSYVFACNEDFFAYPNNYNHYVGYYKDTFQHGGVSLEEMLIPCVTLQPKK